MSDPAKIHIIDDLDNCRLNCGEKGKNLKILNEVFTGCSEISVPETLVLPVELFRTIMGDFRDCKITNYEDIKINPKFRKKILDGIRLKFGFQNLVIRSSATCEDSIFFSSSGRYDSFLNIKTDKEIIKAIKKIYYSLFSDNSRLYGEIYNIDIKSEGMAVLIQPVAPVVNSGVIFSCDPVNHDHKYIIESTKGLGTAVVEGNGEIFRQEVSYRDRDRDSINLLLKAVDLIKQRFGYEVDVEWGVDTNHHLYIFQARPIIFNNSKFKVDNLKFKRAQECSIISKGFSIGKISNTAEEGNRKILFQYKKYDQDNLTLLLSSRGIILKQNSKLSHMSNIIRELAKPCLFTSNLEFHENHLYVMDAFNGRIIDFLDLDDKSRIKAFFNFFEYSKETLEKSYEKFNGVLDIKRDDKIEEVVFGIEEEKVVFLLKENGFRRNLIKQRIFTYDFDDNFLIKNNVIFRIQIVDAITGVQFKLLNSENKHYRIEKAFKLLFDTEENAKSYMKSFALVETGYQERKITSYKKGNINVNIIKWPNSAPYLGIEGKKLSDLNNANKLLNLREDQVTGVGGKQIFERLGLSLKDCEFKKRGDR